MPGRSLVRARALVKRWIDCPTVRGRIGVASELPEAVNSVLEIVVDGLDRQAIEEALRAGLDAACLPGVAVAPGFGPTLDIPKMTAHTSCRLGDQWRVIYRVVPEHLTYYVESITAHDYRR